MTNIVHGSTMELQAQYMDRRWTEYGQNMDRTRSAPCSFHGNSMNNRLSYCGLIDAKKRASDKDLSTCTSYEKYW